MMKKKLVFIGDSLTEWFDWGRRFPAYDVQNLGISGERVEGLVTRRERIRSQVNAPDFVFLMSGINNLAGGQEEIDVPYREFVRNLTTWYKQARIVVQSVLPTDMTWLENSTIEAVNRKLAAIAREFNAEYLDVYRLFLHNSGKTRNELLDEDGVHLSKKGYVVWADEVERFLLTKKDR
jgi:lysophospholipase L1-like esterase